MKKIDVLNINGEKVKDITLNKDVFGITPNDTVLYDAIKLAQNATRQGTASVKGRSDVSGGGRKPWRQKGTGRARQGSIRAPHWYHGAVAFGQQFKNYTTKMNRKERRLALKSALSYLVKDNGLLVLDEIKFETNKTKEMIALLKTFELENNKVLLVVSELDDNVCLASRNLGNVKVVLPGEVNTYDVLNCDNMVATEAALKTLEEVLSALS